MVKEKQGVQLAKSYRERNLEKRENKKKALESTYQHLCIREGNPWEIVDYHKCHNCNKCIKEKSVKELGIYDPKYNPKL